MIWSLMCIWMTCCNLEEMMTGAPLAMAVTIWRPIADVRPWKWKRLSGAPFLAMAETVWRPIANNLIVYCFDMYCICLLPGEIRQKVF